MTTSRLTTTRIPWLILVLVTAGCGKSGSSTEPPPPPEIGRIEVLSNPPGAAIFLDGSATGTATPDTLDQVAAGAHTITLRLPSYADSSAVASVIANSLARVSIALRRVLTYSPPPIAFDRRTFTVNGRLHYAATGDFNGDGRVDFVVATVTDRQFIRTLTGAGDGTFSPGVTVLDTTATIWGLASGDLNRDGRPDLVALLSVLRQGRLVTWLSNGDGTFQRAATVVFPYEPVATISPLFVGDLSGDGAADVMIGYLAGSNVLGLGVWTGMGDGSLQAMTAYTKGFPSEISNPTGLAMADLDRDGRQDLAQGLYGLQGSPGGVLLWRGAGAGQLAPAVYLPTGGYPVDLGVGDFNGDGFTDLATANTGGASAQGSVSLLLGRGDGTFGPVASFLTGLYSVSLEAADFNSDGRLDLVTADQFGNSVSALGGTGDGWFAPATSSAVSVSPGVLLRADCNGDGRADLLVPSRPYPEVSPSTVDLLLGRP